MYKQPLHNLNIIAKAISWVLCACSLFWLPISFAFVCHPIVNPNVPQYLVAYGSLMDKQSNSRTYSLAQENFPVWVRGYKRSWAVHGALPGYNSTFLSVIHDPNASFNGLLYKINHPDEMKQYDVREEIYCRIELKADSLETFHFKLPQAKQVWIYVASPKNQQYPSPTYPIVQSYVDIFLRGCLDIEKRFNLPHFAQDCIKSTEQWSIYWVNDRIYPRRPFIFEPAAPIIDRLLKSTLPNEFKHIRIESSGV